MQLSQPRFHPSDGGCTYDIAVAEVPDATRATLEAQNIVPVEINQRYDVSTADEGTRLTAAGYPAAFAKAILAGNRDEPFPPYEIEGTFRHMPRDGIAQNGFETRLCEWFFAQVDGKNSLGEGMSGGPVHLSAGRHLAGIVLATGDFQSTSSPQTVRGFVFAGSQRVAEALFA
jgi:hypothetical protein